MAIKGLKGIERRRYSITTALTFREGKILEHIAMKRKNHSLSSVIRDILLESKTFKKYNGKVKKAE